MAQDPWAVVSQTPVQPQKTAKADPWAVVNQSPIAAPKDESASASSTPDITANPNHEGTYAMIGANGKKVEIPYSQVRGFGDPHSVDAKNAQAMKDLGYRFADESEQKRFLKDLSADPKYGADGYGNGIIGWLHNGGNDLTVGMLREIAKSAVGMSDTANKALHHIAGQPYTGPHDTPMSKKIREFAESDPRDLTEQIGGGIEQIGELLVPEAEIGKLAEGTKVARAIDAATHAKGVGGFASKVAAEGVKAAAEQGGQAFVKSSGNKEEAKRSAELGGVVGAAFPVAGAFLKPLGEFAGDVGRFFAKVGDIQTGKIVRETAEANEKIGARAKEIIESNEQKIAQAQKDHAAELEDAKAKYEAKVEKAKKPAEKAEADNEYKIEQARIDHEHEVEKARLKHEQDVAEQAKNEAQRAVADRAQKVLRGRLYARMKTIQSAAQDYFKRNYADVENIINRTDGKGVPHLDESNTVPMSDLADAVSDAKKKLEGSDESIKVFNDITKKIHGAEKAEKASGLTENELESLAPDELEALHKEGGAPRSIGFSDLKGYYSELGRQLASPSVHGDVKQAIVALRDSIDGMQYKLAKDAGVGSRYNTLRNQYRNYAKGFLDYQGPNESGSKLAYALKANDAHNATKHFIGMEPEELSRVRQALAGGNTADTHFVEGEIMTPGGKSIPADIYRKNTTKLLDNFLANERTLDSIPKAKPVGEFVPPEPKKVAQRRVPEVEPVGEFVPPEKKPVKLDDVPQKDVMTPEKLRKLKEANLQNASIVSHFGRYMALGGLLGGMLAFTAKDPVAQLRRGAEGVLVGSVSPYIIAKLLEREDVISALTKVTQNDLKRLMKLPPDQRLGVEDAIKQLAEEAMRKGRLKKPSPWLRVIGAKAAVEATRPTKDSTNGSDQTDQDIQKELDQMQGGQNP